MDQQNIRRDVEAIIRSHSRRLQDSGPWADTANLCDDLNINSADLIDVVLDLEEKFEIQIGDDDVNRLQTAGDLHSLIHRLAGVRPAAGVEPSLASANE